MSLRVRITTQRMQRDGALQVRSRDEALEWTRRFPNPRGEGLDAEIEVRQLFEMEDFADVPGVENFRDLEALRG